MSDDIKECLVVENDIVQVIVIKKTDCSMREAINRAVDKLLEVRKCLPQKNLTFYIISLKAVNNKSMELAGKIYQLKELAKASGKKEVQVII